MRLLLRVKLANRQFANIVPEMIEIGGGFSTRNSKRNKVNKMRRLVFGRDGRKCVFFLTKLLHAEGRSCAV